MSIYDVIEIVLYGLAVYGAFATGVHAGDASANGVKPAPSSVLRGIMATAVIFSIATIWHVAVNPRVYSERAALAEKEGLR